MDYSFFFYLLFYSHILKIFTYYSFPLTYYSFYFTYYSKLCSIKTVSNRSLQNVYTTLYRESETETTATNNIRNDNIYYLQMIEYSLGVTIPKVHHS